MDRELDDIERMLADSVERFLATQDCIARMRRSHHTGQVIDRTVWASMAKAGWLGLRLPERVGGSALGIAHAEVVARALGRALLPEPYLLCAIQPGALLASIPPSTAADVLMRSIADGSLVVGVALSNASSSAGAGDDVVGLEQCGDGFRLSGTRSFVVADANMLVVLAELDGDVVLISLPTNTGGVSVERQPMASGSATGTYAFRDVVLPAEAVLATGQRALLAVEISQREGTLLAAAHLCGIADAVVQRTTQYLKQRIQFDQPLSSFQVLRHKVVDMALATELAKATVRDGLAVFGAGGPPAALAVSAAKARASQAALDICETAVHLHGAMGYTAEADIGHYLDAALRWSSTFGDAPAHRSQFAKLIDLSELAS